MQVVSASENGAVSIWMVDTSQKVKQWTDAHGSAKLTALTQDYSETRILTGAMDGTVKVSPFYHLVVWRAISTFIMNFFYKPNVIN